MPWESGSLNCLKEKMEGKFKKKKLVTMLLSLIGMEEPVNVGFSFSKNLPTSLSHFPRICQFVSLSFSFL